jgi:hypothetical protein
VKAPWSARRHGLDPARYGGDLFVVWWDRWVVPALVVLVVLAAIALVFVWAVS